MANEFIIKKGFHSKADSQVTGSINISATASAGYIKGTVVSGSYVGDGSSLTGVSAFPFTGDAQITGSLLISGSTDQGCLFYPTALRVDGGVYIVSGSNTGIVGLTIENTQAPSSAEAAGGAGIQMIGATGTATPGVTGSIYVKDDVGGGGNPHHPGMVLETKDGGMHFTVLDDLQQGSAFYFDKSYMALNMDLVGPNEAEMSFMINNGGDSHARFVIGQSSNGYYFENSGKDDPFKIGYTTGDQGSGTYLDRILIRSASVGSEVMQIGAESKDMNLSVSGSITTNNTASAAVFSGSTYYGDGSNLTGISAFPFTGSAEISGSLSVDGTSRTLFTSCSLVYSGSNVTQVTQSFTSGNTQITDILYSGSFADGNPLSIAVTGSDGVNKLYTMAYSASLITEITVT